MVYRAQNARFWLMVLLQRARAYPGSERFSSGDLAGLKDVDGLGELPGAPGAAAQLAQDPPRLDAMKERASRSS
jgi:hypothetical protein